MWSTSTSAEVARLYSMHSIIERNYKLTAISHHHIIYVPSVLQTEAGLDHRRTLSGLAIPVPCVSLLVTAVSHLPHATHGLWALGGVSQRRLRSGPGCVPIG